jgi:hypothetical protein
MSKQMPRSNALRSKHHPIQCIGMSGGSRLGVRVKLCDNEGLKAGAERLRATVWPACDVAREGNVPEAKRLYAAQHNWPVVCL